ncbi:hypothetical protein [Kiloniella laminariae]|uniref:hypothetical protein n=1 Tax=Kiloniella laminariae TaxID=454162 RepID=UPI0012FA6E38|nr:hypothetical protein [Kiloniella laminariae]
MPIFAPKKEFFDYDYVMWAWKNLPDIESLNSQVPEPVWDAYQAWEEAAKKQSVFEAMEIFNAHPDREAFKKAHDLTHIWEFWARRAGGAVRRPANGGAEYWQTGWNDWTEHTCNRIKKANFPEDDGTTTCIIPDWRPAEWKAEDEAALEEYRKKQAAN